VHQEEVCTGAQPTADNIDGGLNVVWVVKVQSVEIRLDDLVAKTRKGRQNGTICCEIWWSHVGWVLSNDTEESCLNLSHLRCDSSSIESCEICVGPTGEMLISCEHT